VEPRQRGDDVLCDAVGEVVVGVRRDLLEGQHRDPRCLPILGWCLHGRPRTRRRRRGVRAADGIGELLRPGVGLDTELPVQGAHAGLVLTKRLGPASGPGVHLHEPAVRGLAGRVHGQPAIERLYGIVEALPGDELLHQPVHGVASPTPQPLACPPQPALEVLLPR
jgi:hypothetical protein